MVNVLGGDGDLYVPTYRRRALAAFTLAPKRGGGTALARLQDDDGIDAKASTPTVEVNRVTVTVKPGLNVSPRLNRAIFPEDTGIASRSSSVQYCQDGQRYRLVWVPATEESGSRHDVASDDQAKAAKKARADIAFFRPRVYDARTESERKVPRVVGRRLQLLPGPLALESKTRTPMMFAIRDSRRPVSAAPVLQQPSHDSTIREKEVRYEEMKDLAESRKKGVPESSQEQYLREKVCAANAACQTEVNVDAAATETSNDMIHHVSTRENSKPPTPSPDRTTKEEEEDFMDRDISDMRGPLKASSLNTTFDSENRIGEIAQKSIDSLADLERIIEDQHAALVARGILPRESYLPDAEMGDILESSHCDEFSSDDDDGAAREEQNDDQETSIAEIYMQERERARKLVFDTQRSPGRLETSALRLDGNDDSDSPEPGSPASAFIVRPEAPTPNRMTLGSGGKD